MEVTSYTTMLLVEGNKGKPVVLWDRSGSCYGKNWDIWECRLVGDGVQVPQEGKRP
jgi:hypothetical protein